jgi:c-di-GMP-binding flagellar brake protein YcgR
LQKERRRHPRFFADFEIDYSFNNNSCEFSDKSQVRNVSMGGLSFKVHNIVKQNTRLKVDMRIPGADKAISAVCRLVWRKERKVGGPGKVVGGLQFLKIRSQDKKKLDEYICTLMNKCDRE